MRNTSQKPRFEKSRSFGASKKPWGKTTFKTSTFSSQNKTVATIRTKGPSPIPTRAPGEFPMRINKYLSWKGFATRQGADELIKKRSVTLNGRLAILGDQVQATDVVEVRSNKQAEAYVYYAYNKPRGVSTEPAGKTPDISKSISLKGVFPVGGLDINADGLIILTNDGRVTNRLLNPTHAHMKEYVIRTLAPVKPAFKEKMEAGVILNNTPQGKVSNTPSAPIHCTVHMIREDMFSLRISDHENRIRQMCSIFFAEIESMTRTKIFNISLERLPANAFRKIEGDELKDFLGSLGL